MGDIDKEDDSLAIELYRNTMTGQWEEVAEMYKKHQIKAFSAKINTSGDTALHVAVSIAPEKWVRQLVRVIQDWYDEEVKKIEARYDTEVKKIKDRYVEEVEEIKDKLYKLYEDSLFFFAEYDVSLKSLKKKLDDDINVYDEKVEKEITNILESAVWIKDHEGNTPLHVAASTGTLNICILLLSIDSIQSLGIHNNLGESPLFVAAFHGRQEIFLLLHLLPLMGNSNIHRESLDPAYTRIDGETILHCAIRWEYFGEHICFPLFTLPLKNKLWINVQF